MGHEFAELFQQHYQFLYRTAYSVTGSKPDAEDVVQAIFLRLLQRGAPVEVRTNLKAYLYRAAVNGGLSSVRSRKHRDLLRDVHQLVSPAESESEADDRIRQALIQAMAQLRPKAIEILILHYEHNYSDREIARLLKTSRGTIAVTLYRARAQLKRLMTRALKEDHRDT